MCTIQSFTFGPFQENTFVLFDETLEAVIIDPGCYRPSEEIELAQFIEKKGLKIKYLLNTHAHIDHILGNHFVCEKYQLKPQLHKDDQMILEEMAPRSAQMYGFSYKTSPSPEKWLQEGDKIHFGNTILDVLHTPGHAPGHIVFVNAADHFVINGDVLFQGSIGRTDLPFCNHQDLIDSIQNKLYTLPNDYKVYTGHGDPTSIGEEKQSNPFVRAKKQ